MWFHVFSAKSRNLIPAKYTEKFNHENEFRENPSSKTLLSCVILRSFQSSVILRSFRSSIILRSFRSSLILRSFRSSVILRSFRSSSADLSTGAFIFSATLYVRRKRLNKCEILEEKCHVWQWKLSLCDLRINWNGLIYCKPQKLIPSREN